MEKVSKQQANAAKMKLSTRLGKHVAINGISISPRPDTGFAVIINVVVPAEIDGVQVVIKQVGKATAY